ncbi:MAG: tRNA (N(6)-L-threonylcarbamoyladenosine(37)-C(2))-methylthiotransferase MtaB [Clostridia bacterium]|nr:tRNA (N(6)-L-threonylcarbamoyladenosine(37)-C(2))-methylthiotransferase MtaB [Clostridia bacterium]
MRIALCTLGCKVNQYDTQTMRELLEDAGHTIVEFDDVADVYIVNTCTVTQIADKKSRQMISRARELSPKAKVIAAGCYAQRAPRELLLQSGADMVVGTAKRGRVVTLLEELLSASAPIDAVTPVAGIVFEDTSATRENRTRAHLKIQDGCDRFCAYCAIPLARGNARSRPLDSVRSELVKLDSESFREVVLTGVHLMSYGIDLDDGTGLLDAIAQFEGLHNIVRIRLGSLEPQLITEDFARSLAQNPKICHQFHLSLQSGSASVLRRMRRRYSPDDYARCVALLREHMPDAAITTDIIVGFPGETDDEFDETVAFARAIGFARAHVFPYSRRSGTAAADMPGQICNAVKRERAAALIAVARELETRYLTGALGSVKDVLFETWENGVLSGYTDTYIRVAVECQDASLCGTIRPCRLTRLSGDAVLGCICG